MNKQSCILTPLIVTKILVLLYKRNISILVGNRYLNGIEHNGKKTISFQ